MSQYRTLRIIMKFLTFLQVIMKLPYSSNYYETFSDHLNFILLHLLVYCILVSFCVLFQGLKILLPHIGLTLLLLLYMAGGAAILMWMEGAPEMSRRVEKLDNVTKLYNLIFNETWQLCQQNVTRENVASKLKPLLNELSKTHEYDDRFTDDDQLWTDDPDKLRSRWTYSAALLYSLTVITTTGKCHR